VFPIGRACGAPVGTTTERTALVNASLNWASIVGIVLAVGGAFLYFMRSFKPALARDYDVFFAAIGLLCGGILFFQGWRLDPILQFGQFLLAATTVFFAYESVRLRGVTTEQARRSSYFEDEEEPLPFRPRGGLGGGRGWESDADRFDEPEPLRRRIPSREEGPEEDFYRPRRSSRAAIPERAASRRPASEEWETTRREPDPKSPAATPREVPAAPPATSGSDARKGNRVPRAGAAAARCPATRECHAPAADPPPRRPHPHPPTAPASPAAAPPPLGFPWERRYAAELPAGAAPTRGMHRAM
jgi:hypothetical protein